MPDDPARDGPEAADGAAPTAQATLTWDAGPAWRQAAEDEAPPRPDAVLLGRGGMGEVWRIRDETLRRDVALKVLRPELRGRAEVRARFVAEAQLTAQLDHPGIVPVYAVGEDAHGRPWFTMKEVRGRTLSQAAAELSPRQHLDVLHRVCEAVAAAHARGVVHRDLKPSNVMLGSFGEVLVLDWGIASEDEADVDTLRGDLAATGDRLTRMGQVPGTPGFLAPELLDGQRPSPRSDVYALGCMLAQVSLDLGDLVERCKAADPDRRPADAGALATEIAQWLAGSAQRERALELADAARARIPEAHALRARGQALLDAAAEQERSTPPGTTLAEKRRRWALEDEGEALLRQAALVDVEVEAGLRGALAHAPDDPIVNAALAEHHLDRLQAAERESRLVDAMREEALVRRHLEPVPDGHPAGRRCRSWLRGTGRVVASFDQPRRAVVARFEERDRVLRPVTVRDLGEVASLDLELPHGSYLLKLDGQPIPFVVDRLEETRWRAPGEAEDRVLSLPEVPLAPDEALVPQGWFIAGGDARAPNSPPRMRLWLDDFVMRRQPVSNVEYLAFLDDLVARGDDARALACVPRTGPDNPPLWGRGPDGRFYLRPDEEGDEWEPDWAVAAISYDAAEAYAAWTAARTGLPWRLPDEWEWEKAARGVDGRAFPWGDRFDRDFCRNQRGQGAYPFPAAPHEHPEDTSVTGVRHLAGNFHDWCATAWTPVLAWRDGDAVRPAAVPPDHPVVVLRGASWGGNPGYLRAATRQSMVRTNRSTLTSFRLVRSLP